MRGAKGFSCAGVAGLCPSTVCEYVGFGAHQTELGIDSVRRGAFGKHVFGAHDTVVLERLRFYSDAHNHATHVLRLK